MVRAKYLISERVGAARRCGSRDWTGAHYLPITQPDIEAGKPLAPAAVKTNSAITLAIGDRRRHPASRVIGSGAGVGSHRTALLSIGRKAEGAHHVAVELALLVDVAHISVARRAGVTKLETDAIASADIAFAIRDLVINETVRLRTKCVLLIPANRKRRIRGERFDRVETESCSGAQDLGDGQNRPNSRQTVNHKYTLGAFEIVFAAV